jgi:hypothetical protein
LLSSSPTSFFSRPKESILLFCCWKGSICCTAGGGEDGCEVGSSGAGIFIGQQNLFFFVWIKGQALLLLWPHTWRFLDWPL